MTGTNIATLVRSGVAETTAQHRPLGLGSSSLPHQPLAACPRGGGAARSLQRQWTTAKPGRRGADVSCNVLPFFLDLSLAFAPGMEFFDAVKSSVDSEVVFQATLQVPAHHALACRLNAYGTPFAAPDLQAAAHELRDEDLEFAACLATPPDLDEQLSVNFGRVMSMLEKNQQHGAGGQAQIATRAGGGTAGGGGGSSAGSVQQAQLRATPVSQRAAPKVLVSVDEAEGTAAQLQRNNSAKKQPRMLMEGYGKRALQALLGLGYLLTVLHEKSLGGGKLEFSAAITAANIISPHTSDSHSHGHLKPRRSSGLGVLAGLRQLMRECPSLSPNASMSGRRQQTLAAAAAAGAAAAGVAGEAGSSGVGAADATSSSGSSRLLDHTMSPRRLPKPASSFEAAWERVLHPPLVSSSGGGSGNYSGGGLQLQLSISAPCRMRSSSIGDGGSSSTPGSTPRTPLSSLFAAASAAQHQQQQQQQGAVGMGASSSPSAAAAAAASSPSAHRSSPLAKGTGGVLEKMHDFGRSSSMEQLLDGAIEQLQQQQQQQQRSEPSATDLMSLAGDSAPAAVDSGEVSAFAKPAAAATSAALEDSAVLPCTPIRPRVAAMAGAGGVAAATPAQQQQSPATPPSSAAAAAAGGGGVASFYLADQGPLTSPLCAPWTPSVGGAGSGGSSSRQQHLAAFGSPWGLVSSNPGTPNSATAGSAGGVSPACQRPAAAGQQPDGRRFSSNSMGSVPGTPPGGGGGGATRMLLPVMSMRLTCSPAWQFAGADESRGSMTAGAGGGGEKARHNSGTGAGAAATAAAAAADVAGPSLTLADFIAAADADASKSSGGDASSSSSSSAASARAANSRPPAVHMHQPTLQELQQRQLDKLREQQEWGQEEADEQEEGDGMAAAAADDGGYEGGEGEDQPTGLLSSRGGGSRGSSKGINSSSNNTAITGSPIMSFSLPQGLWPTMSFSLVPVRLPPTTSPKPPGLRGKGAASCPL